VSVKADWGLQALGDGVQKVDPFGSASSVAMSPEQEQSSWAYPVSIETETSELERLLSQLTRTEARFFNQGITCPLKDRGEFSCLACPFSKAEETDSAKCGLCRAGCDQERLATLLIAQRSPHDGV